MTTRERRLSVMLIGFILVVGVGFFGYQFVIAPLNAKKERIRSLDDEIELREARVARITRRQPDLAKWKKLSLPPDPEKKNADSAVVQPGKSPADNARADLAQREYEDELNKMLRAAGYAATDVGIIPKKPDAKSAPTLATKKPIYTKLIFTVQLKGDMASLVDFMGRFYKVRLLHQIRNITIQKPIGADLRAAATVPGGQQAAAAPSTDLDVTLTIEALVLDNAEQRKTLLPDKMPELPPLLARTNDQYAMIAGKNMFFGMAPRGSTNGQDSGRSSYVDTEPYASLEGITLGENGWEATIRDRIHNWIYTIAPRRTGGYQVNVMYYLGGSQRKDSTRSGKTLALRNSDGDIVHEWHIVRIDQGHREVILRDDAKGEYFALHMGDYLANKKKLQKSDLDELGIKMEPAKPPAAKGTSILDDISDPKYDP